MSNVDIIEVGPRDGLQNIPVFVPTETKVALIRALGGGFTASNEAGALFATTDGLATQWVLVLSNASGGTATIGQLDLTLVCANSQ